MIFIKKSIETTFSLPIVLIIDKYVDKIIFPREPPHETYLYVDKIILPREPRHETYLYVDKIILPANHDMKLAFQ